MKSFFAGVIFIAEENPPGEDHYAPLEVSLMRREFFSRIFLTLSSAGVRVSPVLYISFYFYCRVSLLFFGLFYLFLLCLLSKYQDSLLRHSFTHLRYESLAVFTKLLDRSVLKCWRSSITWDFIFFIRVELRIIRVFHPNKRAFAISSGLFFKFFPPFPTFTTFFEAISSSFPFKVSFSICFTGVVYAEDNFLCFDTGGFKY